MRDNIVNLLSKAVGRGATTCRFADSEEFLKGSK